MMSKPVWEEKAAMNETVNNLYKAYCKEGFDENGILNQFEVQYPENYNFGYDIVDEIAKLDPERRAESVHV